MVKMKIQEFENELLNSDFEEVKELTDKEKKANALNELYCKIEQYFDGYGVYAYNYLLNNKNELLAFIYNNNNIEDIETMIYLKKQFDLIAKRLYNQEKKKRQCTIENIAIYTQCTFWIMFIFIIELIIIL